MKTKSLWLVAVASAAVGVSGCERERDAAEVPMETAPGDATAPAYEPPRPVGEGEPEPNVGPAEIPGPNEPGIDGAIEEDLPGGLDDE